MKALFLCHKTARKEKNMKDTLILKDGTVVTLEAYSNLDNIRVAAADRAAMLAVWSTLTEDNLAEAQVKNGEGLVVGSYADLVLVSETSVVAADESVLTTYSLREKTDTEKRLDALEEGQEVLDGAVDDLGAVTSLLAEQAGGGAE